MTTTTELALLTTIAGLKRFAEHLLGSFATRPDALDRLDEIVADVVREVKGMYPPNVGIEDEADAVGAALQTLENLFAQWRGQIEIAHAEAIRRAEDDGSDALAGVDEVGARHAAPPAEAGTDAATTDPASPPATAGAGTTGRATPSGHAT